MNLAPLATFRFRPEPPPAAPAARAPAPAPLWTYEETLAELRRRGASLLDAEPGVRVVTRRRLSASLASAIAAHGPALREALRLGVLGGTTPAPWSASAWPEATRLHAAWFGLRFSPSGPVALDAGRRVNDHAAFRRAVARGLATGPDAAGGAGLADDLASLFARFGPAPTRLRVMRSDRSLAA